jgi:ParB/RepB/Spo0J family partition protein
MMGDQRFSQTMLESLVESGAVVEVPWRSVRPMKGQPRTHFNRSRLEALKLSIAHKGQLKPGEVRVLWGGVEQQFELIDGERRLRACSLLDRPFRAWVTDVKDPEDQFERSFISNLNREGHTPLEIAEAVQRIRNSTRVRALPKGEQIAAVAESAGRSIAWVNSYLGLARLDYQLRKLLLPKTKKKERIPLVIAFRLSTLPKDDQVTEWERIKKRKLTSRQAQRQIDKTILKKGLHEHRRGRRPSDDMDVLLRFLRHTESETGAILDMPDTQFERMFASRDIVQRKRLADELEMTVAALDRVRQRIKAALRSVPAPVMVQ